MIEKAPPEWENDYPFHTDALVLWMPDTVVLDGEFTQQQVAEIWRHFNHLRGNREDVDPMMGRKEL